MQIEYLIKGAPLHLKELIYLNVIWYVILNLACLDNQINNVTKQNSENMYV
jgi:hypothetical protein